MGQGQSHWQPWRYDRDAYEAAATAVVALQAATRLPRLAGEPVATLWDPGLAAAMACHDVRIEEELSSTPYSRTWPRRTAIDAGGGPDPGRTTAGPVVGPAALPTGQTVTSW